jgi:hypothetical protein
MRVGVLPCTNITEGEGSPGNLVYFDPELGGNVWEYFFEPVSNVTLTCMGESGSQSKGEGIPVVKNEDINLFEGLHESGNSQYS